MLSSEPESRLGNENTGAAPPDTLNDKSKSGLTGADTTGTAGADTGDIGDTGDTGDTGGSRGSLAIWTGDGSWPCWEKC